MALMTGASVSLGSSEGSTFAQRDGEIHGDQLALSPPVFERDLAVQHVEIRAGLGMPEWPVELNRRGSPVRVSGTRFWTTGASCEVILQISRVYIVFLSLGDILTCRNRALEILCPPDSVLAEKDKLEHIAQRGRGKQSKQ